MEDKLADLRSRIADVQNLSRAAFVLEWDQQVWMPPGGARGRAEQMATLQGLAHRLFVSAEVGDLLRALSNGGGAGWAYDSTEASMVRMARRQYERASRVPNELVSRISRAASLGHQTWVRARAENNFALFRPQLEEMVALKREYANCLKPWDHPYDALLDDFEPGMKTADVARLFDGVKGELVDLVRAIGGSRHPVSNDLLHRTFEIERQRAAGREFAGLIGYDWQRGRLDDAVHPFCTTFSTGDVRITTRYDREYLPCALYGVIHETGHALYEQGVDPALEGTGLATGCSMGIHESQSRLWENLVGRSRGFARFTLPALKKTFPEALGSADAESYYRALNKVEPSFIRVEADEVTYNLHIFVRFELEQALIAGELAVKDLPGAWNDRYQKYLGIRPATDAEGMLQDVHWSGGGIGYFPSYALGNLYSVSFLNRARAAIPDLDARIERGDFATLLGWLRENIYRHGSKFLPQELIERVTGAPPESRSYMDYLRGKYAEVYGL